MIAPTKPTTTRLYIKTMYIDNCKLSIDDVNKLVYLMTIDHQDETRLRIRTNNAGIEQEFDSIAAVSVCDEIPPVLNILSFSAWKQNKSIHVNFEKFNTKIKVNAPHSDRYWVDGKLSEITEFLHSKSRETRIARFMSSLPVVSVLVGSSLATFIRIIASSNLLIAYFYSSVYMYAIFYSIKKSIQLPSKYSSRICVKPLVRNRNWKEIFSVAGDVAGVFALLFTVFQTIIAVADIVR